MVEVGFSLLLESTIFFFLTSCTKYPFNLILCNLQKKKKADSNNKENPTSTTTLKILINMVWNCEWSEDTYTGFTKRQSNSYSMTFWAPTPKVVLYLVRVWLHLMHGKLYTNSQLQRQLRSWPRGPRARKAIPNFKIVGPAPITGPEGDWWSQLNRLRRSHASGRSVFAK